MEKEGSFVKEENSMLVARNQALELQVLAAQMKPLIKDPRKRTNVRLFAVIPPYRVLMPL
jgi:hypothetical protein